MKIFIETILKMSVYGSIAVLLVLLLRVVFRRIPKKAVFLFWIVVAVRLVCPVNFRTPLSLFNLAPQSIIDNLAYPTGEDESADTAPEASLNAYEASTEYARITVDSAASETPFADQNSGEGSAAGNQAGLLAEGNQAGLLAAGNQAGLLAEENQAGLLTEGNRAELPAAENQTDIVSTADRSGLLTAAGDPGSETNSGILSYAAILKDVLESGISDVSVSDVAFPVWLVGVAVIMGYVGICVIRANHVLSRLFKRSGRYLESETIHTPFIIGFIKPRICVPSSLDVNEKDYMLLHEHIHVKNHDALIKSFALMLLCLHWFNPFVWLAFRLAMSDLEMRCDEEVVDILGDRIRKEYCLSIVNHAVADNNFRVFTTAFAKKSIGRMEIKMRIKNLINYKKVSKLTTIIVLIIALTATFILTSCADNSATTTQDGAGKVSDGPDLENAKMITGIEATDSGKRVKLTVKDQDSVSKIVVIKNNADESSKEFSIPIRSEQDNIVIGQGPTYRIIDGVGEKIYTDTAEFETDLRNLGFPFNGETDYDAFNYSGSVYIYYDSLSGKDKYEMLDVIPDPETDEPRLSIAESGKNEIFVETEDGMNVNYVFDNDEVLGGRLVLGCIGDDPQDTKDIAIKLCSKSSDRLVYSDGSQLVTQSNIGVTFDSFEEFKAFYSSDNLENIKAGKYAESDPRVSIVSWSQFGSAEADSLTTYLQHEDCYIMQRIFPDGKTHFTLTYFPSYCSIVRLENIPAGTEG